MECLPRRFTPAGFLVRYRTFLRPKKCKFRMSNQSMTDKKRTSSRNPEEFQRKWQHDKLTAMETLAAQSVANDAKTARLKALRLAKTG